MQEAPNTGVGKALDKSFNELSTVENITRNPSVKLAKNFAEIWQIDTEVTKDSFLLEVCLYLGFDEFFPLSIPRIYLSDKSYKEIGLIPHVATDKFICTYHEDTLTLNQNNPTGIIKECLTAAKAIIEKGLIGDNAIEFKKEFGAYWTDTAGKDYDSFSYLSLITEYPNETSLITILALKTPYNRIKYVLYSDKNAPVVKRFLHFLAQNGHSGHEHKALFLVNYGDNISPPFPCTNDDILGTLNERHLVEFKKYINANNSVEKHVFFLADTTESSILVGWKHNRLITKINGYRAGHISQFEILSRYQKNERIVRILVNVYNNNRIENRTSGIVNEKYRFLIAGLGSIGSNLLFFLNALNYPDYKLVDDDALKIENIGRHLLGINAVNQSKVTAIYHHIKNIRPDQDVIIKGERVESLLKNNLDFFNDCSYAFIAIGNQNIEDHIIKLINDGKIIIPVFFLWVEPYAIGGHCLYIHPDDKVDVGSLYSYNLYRKNIIADLEYIDSNPILSKQEAGCQTAYTPYSSNDTVMFLSSIYKWINSIIKDNVRSSSGIQWIGNIKLANELGVRLNNPEITPADSYSHINFEL